MYLSALEKLADQRQVYNKKIADGDVPIWSLVHNLLQQLTSIWSEVADSSEIPASSRRQAAATSAAAAAAATTTSTTSAAAAAASVEAAASSPSLRQDQEAETQVLDQLRSW